MPDPKLPEEREPSGSRPGAADKPAAEPSRQPVPLTPAEEKIGEPAGNLQDRADAFRRRHSTTKP